MKYTHEMKAIGDMACRSLSPKAKAFFDTTQPLHILGFEACDFDGRLFDVRGTLEVSGITLEQLNDLFERAADGELDPL